METRGRNSEDRDRADSRSKQSLLCGTWPARDGGGEETRNGARSVPARSAAGARRFARGSGRCECGAAIRVVHGAASQAGDRYADARFHQLDARESSGSIQSDGGAMRTLFLAFAAAAAALAEIPTPESILGHKPGDDFYLANYEDALGYFKKLAASSNRIKLVHVGKTTQGREWFMAFISSPENLAKLERHKEISRRLAISRGLTDAPARQLAQEGHPIMHIHGGLHATEGANAQHTIQIGYELGAPNDPEYARSPDAVIPELW